MFSFLNKLQVMLECMHFYIHVNTMYHEDKETLSTLCHIESDRTRNSKLNFRVCRPTHGYACDTSTTASRIAPACPKMLSIALVVLLSGMSLFRYHRKYAISLAT